MLDVGRQRLPEAAAAAPPEQNDCRTTGARALTIDGADHYFETRQKELAAAVAAFLDRVFSGKC
jgi:alpha/beta superfamily hydrolase